MRNKIKKNFAVLFFIALIFNWFGNLDIYAATNHEYAQTDEEITEIDEEEIIKSSVVTDYIGGFIFSIGSLTERVTAGIMELFSGHNFFPWADKIIFNTIEILDVNFINPEPGSLLSSAGSSKLSIGDIIRSVYFSGLTIALGFLGILVAVMAIKLAISTIASEKAKYKEAIVKWITALILLFGMHFVLSFVFYLNEQLVIVASKILTESMAKQSEDLANKLSTEVDEEAYKEKTNDFLSDYWDCLVISYGTPTSTAASVTQSLFEKFTDYEVKFFSPYDEEIGLAKRYGYNDTKSELNKSLKRMQILYELCRNEDFKKEVIPNLEDYKTDETGLTWTNFWNSIGDSFKKLALFADNLVFPKETRMVWFEGDWLTKCVIAADYMSSTRSEEELNQMINEAQEEYDSTKGDDRKKARAKIEVYKVARNIVKNGSTRDVFTALGNYFKKMSWVIDSDSNTWSATSSSVTSATLYTMFVIQSLMFLFAYVKRFFYVVVLSVIAPFVVIYDFFTKSVAL